jgi:hypothetical protein
MASCESGHVALEGQVIDGGPAAEVALQLGGAQPALD